MRIFVTACSVVFATTLAIALEDEARACGGCFSPPETDSVVTDHRMILSISKEQTTLYDQIRYAGSPSSFAWVLPISGKVTVGLSSDAVFAALDALTQTSVQPPPRRCPAPSACGDVGKGSARQGDGEQSTPLGDVTVLAQDVVGPYETVQLSASSPQALETWLSAHGYTVAADAKAIVDAYVNEHYDFLALKLVPGAGVDAMRPIRVTAAGMSTVLPLRMITAGTGATVGVTLWVLGEGRYEPQNFGTFVIKDEELVWDWTTSSSNYRALRAQRSDGGTWEIESSAGYGQDMIGACVRVPAICGATGPVSLDAGAYYLPVTSPEGGVIETPEQVRSDDIMALLAGLPLSNLRITRLRADLSHARLGTDLVLGAALDQTELATRRRAALDVGDPPCPIYKDCDVVGEAPRSQAIAAMERANASSGCATGRRSTGNTTATLLALAGCLWLGIWRMARRRTR